MIGTARRGAGKGGSVRFMFPKSICIGGILATAVLVMFAGFGCGPEDGSKGPIVIEIDGKKISLEELREEYEVRYGAGSFDPLPLERKEGFLQTIGDKEVLLRHAKKSFGGLVAPYDRIAREAREMVLLDALERRLSEPAMRDSVAYAKLFEQLNKEMRLSWIINPSDSLVRVAREQISSGRPFEEVAEEYSEEPREQREASRGVWRTGETVPRAVVEELFFENHGPGYVTEVHRTPKGSELFWIDEVRPTDIRAKEKAQVSISQTIGSVLAKRRIEAWTDSLQGARALVIREEALPILTERMKAYWDSLSTRGADAPRVAEEYEPPVSRFTEEEQETVLYETDGRGVTIREFVDRLRYVPMRLWPSGYSIERVREAVERRVLIAWKLDAAKDLKLGDAPELHRRAAIDEERFLLEQLNEKEVAPSIEVTQEDIEAYYAERKESYWSEELIRFSYAVFPTKREAEQFYEEARDASGTWWVGQFTEFRRDRLDIFTVANSDDYLYSEPFPDSVRAMAELGRELGVTDVIEPVAYPSGGWAVSRIARRDHEGYRPLEYLTRGIRMILTRQRTDAKMQDIVEEGRERFGLKLYPEYLEPQESAETGEGG